ncbi:uncharacterized protein Z520_00575 [Fonsecaea multimorphosa CBS 102226]|uniref:Transcription factor domain-containing protein n=1 Tax=Fonsecaea multimorphosa CBS 102226 TaxID=1442371 RepID=A0A0D2L493_9EURO|nr:uncharacterized protein Z520_00575 [Fonsecaea multimorphosa CBS 102226]KIY03884.1 hypothetical protein Z520_00575 [Fonsecaea multimorphosa CBS 102226]OAL32145.1 hypothetical protein AYO22_00594 [Fonsecaea multimorphosa]
MAANANPHTTSFINSSGKPSEWRKKEQVRRQHQHAASVAHQRGQRKRLPRSQSHPAPAASSTALTTPAPRSDLSGSLFDPFDAFFVNNLSVHAQKMFQSAIIDQWPSFALSSRKQDIDRWRSFTVKHALESPYLVPAIAYAGSSYCYFFGSRDPAAKFHRINFYHETLRQLREAMLRPDSQCGDAMLLAVAILTIHGPPNDMQAQTLVDSQQLRDYEYYGSKVWEPTHFQALLSLVKQRGGLHKVGINSLAGIIMTIDIADSLSVLRAPAFPLFFPPSPVLQALRQCRKPDKPNSCHGFRFLRNRHLGRRLLSIIEDVDALLDAYDTVLTDPGSSIDFGQLVAAWRILQHQALSLPSGEDLLFNLCRVAIIVFLVECLEPLPVIGAFHRNGSRRLMLLIDECDKREYWQTSSNTMLWATVVGGFVSRETPLRLWYVEQLRGSPVTTTAEHWDKVLHLAEAYLPFRHRQAQGCQQFWSEGCSRLALADPYLRTS